MGANKADVSFDDREKKGSCLMVHIYTGQVIDHILQHIILSTFIIVLLFILQANGFIYEVVALFLSFRELKYIFSTIPWVKNIALLRAGFEPAT